jgi:hypothetical protein
MVFAEVRDGVYDFVLLLHIVAVVVGFGAVALSGIYAAQAKARTGLAALAVVEVNSFVGWRIAQWFIYAVPILGFALLGLSDGAFGFGDLWIWLSIVLYLVGLAISHMVLRTADREFRSVLARSSETVPNVSVADVPQLVALDRRIAAASGALNLLVLVVLILMIWKPGN